MFQALVTALPASVPPIEVWRDYNGRAGIKNVVPPSFQPRGTRQEPRQVENDVGT